MNPHTTFLIWTHYIVAALIGLPATCGTVYFGWQVGQLLWRPTPPIPKMITDQGDTVKLITGAERVLGAAIYALGSLGEGIIKGLFALSCCGLLLAGVVYFAGRGLSGGAGWARLLSGLVFAAMTCVGGLTLLSSGAMLRLAGASGLLLGGYSLWVLVTGFKLK